MQLHSKSALYIFFLGVKSGEELANEMLRGSLVQLHLVWAISVLSGAIWIDLGRFILGSIVKRSIMKNNQYTTA